MEHLRKWLNRLKTKKIKTEDLVYLNELLKSGLPLKTSLDLLSNSYNSELFNSLLNRLQNGEMIENIIVDYLPKEIALFMKNLLRKLSFNESLELSLSFYKKSKTGTKSIEKAITYPLILLFVSLTALYLFDSYGLDSILSLMSSFKVDVSSFNVIRVLLRIFIYSFYALFILISILILFFINKKRIRFFYLFLVKFFKKSLIKTYYTSDFMSLFVITMKLGYKTKDALDILKYLENKPVVALLAHHIDERLMKGDSLKEATSQKYYDDVLAKFINIASYANNYLEILSNYVELSNEKIKNKIKLYTTILQASSYVVIGIVIIFIYQVLFLPMQAINAF